MKRLFAILLFLVIALPFLYADNAVLNLWSGKLYDFPGDGKWQLVAAHGRVLAEGNGCIRFQLPALPAGSSLDAYLENGGKKQKLCFYSPRLFTGIQATAFDLNIKHEKILQNSGVLLVSLKGKSIGFATHIVENFPGKILFVFPQKKDFPLKLDDKWTTISLHHTKNSGRLSVLYNEKEKILDNNGSCTYVKLKKRGRYVIMFSPDFDLENIENALLIKHIAENNNHDEGVGE